MSQGLKRCESLLRIHLENLLDEIDEEGELPLFVNTKLNFNFLQLPLDPLLGQLFFLVECELENVPFSKKNTQVVYGMASLRRRALI